MSKVDSLIIGTKIRASKAVEALTEKKSGDSQIVVALVLIAVAVGLCIIFRNQINDIMTNLFNTIRNSIDKLAGTFAGDVGGK